MVVKSCGAQLVNGWLTKLLHSNKEYLLCNINISIILIIFNTVTRLPVDNYLKMFLSIKSLIEIDNNLRVVKMIQHNNHVLSKSQFDVSLLG